MTHLINQQHLSHLFEIASAATSREEIGNPPHYGTVNKLREVGIPVVPHRAVQMTKADYEYYDYIIAMDEENIYDIQALIGKDKDNKIKRLFRIIF